MLKIQFQPWSCAMSQEGHIIVFLIVFVLFQQMTRFNMWQKTVSNGFCRDKIEI